MAHIDRQMHRLAAASALAGGAVLLALVAMTTASVAGRALVFAGLGPVPGDFELVEAGLAFAVIAFLPWCQINDGHARVDLVAARLPARARAALRIASDLVLLAAAIVIAWRLGLGLVDQLAFPQTTLILQFPLWWPYLVTFGGTIIWVAVAAWCAVRGAWRHPTGPAPR